MYFIKPIDKKGYEKRHHLLSKPVGFTIFITIQIVLKKLLKDISQCEICASEMAVTPRPVVSVSQHSKIMIIGQAPGSVVHRTGIPWDDKSGENLRQWMGISSEVFYDTSQIGIVPMGFCYPGKGKTGDLPPRKECAPQWHQLLWACMTEIKLTLLIGKYAQDYYLKEKKKRTLTETVQNFNAYLPEYFVLPHPSPRNNIWMKKNEWFKVKVLPVLKNIVNDLVTQ